jgi:hypothetical protein
LKNGPKTVKRESALPTGKKNRFSFSAHFSFGGQKGRVETGGGNSIWEGQNLSFMGMLRTK